MSRGLRAIVAAVAVAFVVTGCGGSDPAPAATASATATPTATVDAKHVADLAYAPADPAGDKGHLLDLYLPEDQSGPVPLVIWSHGSAFREESGRDQTVDVAAALVPKGYAVAGVAVRSSGVAKFPAQLSDIKAAIRYLRSNAGEYGLDANRFATMGESSGAWGASMAGLTAGVPQLEGDLGVQGVSSAVKAVVAFYPPTDFLTMDAQGLDTCPPPAGATPSVNCHDVDGSPESDLLGCRLSTCPGLVANASPARYAKEQENLPPFLIIHGQKDYNVPYGQGQELFDALDKRCKPVTLITVPQGEHGQWLQYLTDPSLSAGSTSRTAADCLTNEASVTPSWDTITSFLATALT